MRVALTGASGFTGRFVIDALARQGVDAVRLDVDLRDPAAVEHTVETTAFDRIIHLAARAFVDARDWAAFYAVNLVGTFQLLDSLARIKPGTRCVLASSAQVYGPGAEGLIGEDASTCPSNHYAISKLAMEHGAALWRDTLDLVIARPFNYTGVGQDPAYLIPKIVDHFRRRADVIELGNLWVRRDFGDVRSVADAYAELILSENPPPVVNIATGHLWSIGDIIDMLSAISGHRIDVRVNPAFVRANDVPALGGDSSRLRKALPMWRPRELSDTLAWMYADGAHDICRNATQ